MNSTSLKTREEASLDRVHVCACMCVLIAISLQLRTASALATGYDLLKDEGEENIQMELLLLSGCHSNKARA